MIKADKLTMHYGPVVALKNVSFEVRRGEVVGLLGPNGAGKSTAMKILTTYLYPTSGTAQVGGIDILKDPLAVRKIIGYLPEILPLYMDMEVRAYLDFVGRARGLTGSKLKQRTEIVLDECGLRPMYRKVIHELSKGFKQRTGLAQALIHDPDIIVLDEPTSGLDPHQIVEIRQLVRNLASTKTVILSTHILQEVEATADRIVIINRGQIVGEGTFDELRSRAKQHERTLVSVAGVRAEVERLLSGLEGAQKVQFVSEEEGFVTFIVKSRVGVPLFREVGRLAQAKSWVLRELSNKPLTLEETFLTLTEPKKRAASQDYSVSKGESAA
ncbi:MAG: ATP-binding cassette domain-containing protein [Candidatus Hydrogenedentes bacterium]|nr:ATP-binding cassette domain-containing protein [Candidatus Hydrogenedentota bacterium]